jgi:hypothetical protein
MATVSAISDAEVLPGRLDFVTTFHPGKAHARRVAGYNLWVLYRFDDVHVEVLAVKDQPPVPLDDE